MEIKKILSRTGIIFLGLFVILTYVGMQINFSELLGEPNQFFTLFQFFGPIAGGFLGVFGVVAVLLAEIVNFVLVGKEATLINIARLAPMLFGAYYFAKNKDKLLNDKLGIIIPLAAIVAFSLHPVASEVWYYSLLWLIPIVVKFLPQNLFFRSLGATFTAHAVGGALWVWTVPMPPEAWLALIPIVLFERVLFAIGISVSYVAFSTLLYQVDTLTKENLRKIVDIENRYAIQTIVKR